MLTDYCRKIFSLAMMLLTVVSVTAVNEDDNSIAAKAERFYRHHEWASAAAMYTLLLDASPSDCSYYGRAIVISSIRKMPDNEVDLTRRALQNRVPIDSLFTCVRNESFVVGRSDLYERYLLRMKAAEPWMTRTIDGYLLNYYTFRDNPHGMIEYAQTMLAGLPDDRNFLMILARGYVIEDNMPAAMDTFGRILKLYPSDYDSLLWLGNYYAMKGDAARALPYLERAQQERATPYVDATIRQLRSQL